MQGACPPARGNRAMQGGCSPARACTTCCGRITRFPVYLCTRVLGQSAPRAICPLAMRLFGRTRECCLTIASIGSLSEFFERAVLFPLLVGAPVIALVSWVVCGIAHVKVRTSLSDIDRKRHRRVRTVSLVIGIVFTLVVGWWIMLGSLDGIGDPLP